jgi:choline dehydrogenase-like flavoprotein
MLSGVGPKEDLEKLEIPCKVDLPVGKNLQDHLTFMGLDYLLNETEPAVETSSNEILKKWLVDGKGPLSSPGGIEGIAYIKTKISKEVKDFPDIELIFASRVITKDGAEIAQKVTALTDDMYHSQIEPLEGHKVWSIFPLLMHPKSVGQITLKSNNPFQWPKIEGNFLSDKENIDVHTFVEGIKAALEIGKTKAFQEHGCKFVEKPVPGCDKHEFGTDEYWGCAVRHMTRTVHHQVGTCKMGLTNDKTAVVGEDLKVHGIKGLRIADSSVIPFAITAHTNAPAIMIGEKAADLIKESWK